jgi:hypothetical protein
MVSVGVAKELIGFPAAGRVARPHAAEVLQIRAAKDPSRSSLKWNFPNWWTIERWER